MTTSTQTLADFLLARIAEDEANDLLYAHTSACASNRFPDPNSWDPGECNCGSDARRYAESAAKRRIVELHEQAVWHQPAGAFIYSLGRRLVEEGQHLGGCTICAGDNSEAAYPCPTLRALASVYAGHPDYREEWRP